MQKAVDWLRDFAPPEAQGMTFGEAGPVPAQGHIAQQIFWYTAFTADMTDPSVAVTDDEGNLAVAHGTLSHWPLLGRGHEGGLSGRRCLDLLRFYA